MSTWVSLLEAIDAIVVYNFITLAAGRREPRPVPITLQEVSKFTVHGSAMEIWKRRLTGTGTLGTVDSNRVCSFFCHNFCESTREMNVLDIVS